MLKFALSGVPFNERLDLRQTCKAIKELGYNAIELLDSNLRLLPGKTASEGYWSIRDIDEAKTILEEEKVEAAVIHFRLAYNKEAVLNAEHYSREFIYAIDVAEKLGVKGVLHYVDKILRTNMPDMTILRPYMERALRHAEKKGITLYLENEFDDCGCYPQNMLKIVKEFNSPYFKTNFDSPNYYCAGSEGYPFAYNLLKEHIGYVHLKGACIYDKAYYDSRYFVGFHISGGVNKGQPIAFVSSFESAVNNEALLKELVSDGYQGWVTLEPHAEYDLSMEVHKKDTVYLKEHGFLE